MGTQRELFRAPPGFLQLLLLVPFPVPASLADLSTTVTSDIPFLTQAVLLGRALTGSRSASLPCPCPTVRSNPPHRPLLSLSPLPQPLELACFLQEMHVTLSEFYHCISQGLRLSGSSLPPPKGMDLGCRISVHRNPVIPFHLQLDFLYSLFL